MELYLEGERHLVTLSEITHPVHCMVHAEFENGYENIFFADVETGDWVEQDLGFTRLASMIGDHLQNSYTGYHIARKELVWHHGFCNDQLIEFGYHRELTAGYPVYEIFATNRRYMFTLVKLKNDQWQLFKIPGCGWDYKESYIHEIPFILGACQ